MDTYSEASSFLLPNFPIVPNLLLVLKSQEKKIERLWIGMKPQNWSLRQKLSEFMMRITLCMAIVLICSCMVFAEVQKNNEAHSFKQEPSMTSTVNDDGEYTLAIKNNYGFFYNDSLSNVFAITSNMSGGRDEELFVVTDVKDETTNRVYVFVKLSIEFDSVDWDQVHRVKVDNEMNTNAQAASSLYLLRIFEQDISGNRTRSEINLGAQRLFLFPNNLKATSMDIDRFSKVLLLSFVDLIYSNNITHQNGTVGHFCQTLFYMETLNGIYIVDREGLLMEETCIIDSNVDPTSGYKIVNRIEVDDASRYFYVLSSAVNYKNIETKLLKFQFVDSSSGGPPSIEYSGFSVINSIKGAIILNIYSEISSLSTTTASNRFLYIVVHFIMNSGSITSEVKQMDLISMTEKKSVNFLPNEESSKYITY